MLCVLALTAALAAAAPALDTELRAVAALPGEPSSVAAAGLTKDDAPILTLENPFAFDRASTKKRVVVFGTSEQTAAVVLGMVRWFKTDPAAAALRARVDLSVLPQAAFDPADQKAVAMTRWITFQAPDAVIEVDDDGVRPIGSGNVMVSNWVARLPITAAALGGTVRAASSTPMRDGQRPPHDVIRARVARDPIEIARLLAKRYPETPSLSYIPSVAWTNTLRLAALTGEPAIGDKVREQTAPWVSGGRPLFGDRIQLTSVAGAMVFAELGGEALPRALEAAALASERKDDGIARYGQGWTDDMFMASAILSRVGATAGRAADLDAAAQLLTDYSARLQRADGIFVHATDGPFAWGRGNGFAALGITETLTRLPQKHPARANLLSIYKRHMAALRGYQSPDGAWRQVIDEPGAYREETATAMLMVAMARGLRLGWLDKSYQPIVDRAWRALAAHVTDEGTLVDVCTGTGVGPTRRYYLDRAAISGADDRGGAMALAAAVEYVELRRLSSRRRAGSSSAEPTAR